MNPHDLSASPDNPTKGRKFCNILPTKWILSVYSSKFTVKFSDLPPFQEFILIFPDYNPYSCRGTVLKRFESTSLFSRKRSRLNLVCPVQNLYVSCAFYFFVKFAWKVHVNFQPENCYVLVQRSSPRKDRYVKNIGSILLSHTYVNLFLQLLNNVQSPRDGFQLGYNCIYRGLSILRPPLIK